MTSSARASQRCITCAAYARLHTQQLPLRHLCAMHPGMQAHLSARQVQGKRALVRASRLGTGLPRSFNQNWRSPRSCASSLLGSGTTCTAAAVPGRPFHGRKRCAQSAKGIPQNANLKSLLRNGEEFFTFQTDNISLVIKHPKCRLRSVGKSPIW